MTFNKWVKLIGFLCVFDSQKNNLHFFRYRTTLIVCFHSIKHFENHSKRSDLFVGQSHFKDLTRSEYKLVLDYQPYDTQIERS